MRATKSAASTIPWVIRETNRIDIFKQKAVRQRSYCFFYAHMGEWSKPKVCKTFYRWFESNYALKKFCHTFKFGTVFVYVGCGCLKY